MVTLVTRCHLFFDDYNRLGKRSLGTKLTARCHQGSLKQVLAFPTKFPFPKKHWDWQSCHEAVRKGKKSWGSHRIVRVGRSVVIVRNTGVHSTKFSRFVHVWILVDSTLAAGGISLLFILLKCDPSQGSWHELWLLFTAVNPFILLNERYYMSSFALSAYAS